MTQSGSNERHQDVVETRPTGTPDVMVVTASGDLDALTAPRLDAAISNALDVPSTAVVVDLSKVDFLSSAGMAVLKDGNEAAGSSRRFCVVADGPVTARPLRLVGLDRVLSLYPTLEAALADIR